MDPEKTVVLKTYSSVAAAESAAARLKVSGIECFIQADDAGGMYPSLQTAEGVKLRVNTGQVADANQILEAETTISPEALEELASQPAAEEPTPAAKSCVRPLPLIVAFLLGVGATVGWRELNRLGTKTCRWDTNGDSRPDEMEVVRNGHVIERARDRNFDGHLDEWFYYDRGKVVRYEADENYDRKVDLWWTYTNDQPVEGRQDTDYNGVPDVTYHRESHILQTADWQPNGTNVIARREISRYGLCVEELRDTDWDGYFDVSVKYDVFGNPIQTNYIRLLSAPKISK